MSRNPPLDNWEELTTRERDELVARHVLGWTEKGISGRKHAPPFSTDIAAAWQWSRVPQFTLFLGGLQHRGSSTAGFRDMDKEGSFCWGHSENPAEAICIAGLRVAGLLQ